MYSRPQMNKEYTDYGYEYVFLLGLILSMSDERRIHSRNQSYDNTLRYNARIANICTRVGAGGRADGGGRVAREGWRGAASREAR